jgi:hypothetical protein
MRFETVNERGTAEKLSDNGRFRFAYGNDFYGSCTFTVDVYLGGQKTFLLREKSIVIEDYDLKKGNVTVLLNISVTFFKRMISNYPAKKAERLARPATDG